MDNNNLIERSFLGYIQLENDGCKATGEPCREPEKCGCWLEMKAFVSRTDHIGDANDMVPGLGQAPA